MLYSLPTQNLWVLTWQTIVLRALPNIWYYPYYPTPSQFIPKLGHCRLRGDPLFLHYI